LSSYERGVTRPRAGVGRPEVADLLHARHKLGNLLQEAYCVRFLQQYLPIVACSRARKTAPQSMATWLQAPPSELTAFFAMDFPGSREPEGFHGRLYDLSIE
jgi:hypothetical protein